MAAQQEIPPAKMTVPQLKEQLRTFNMFTSGKKADLVHRLETALAAAATTGHASDAQQASDSASDDADTGAASDQGVDADALTKLAAATQEAVADANAISAAFKDATVTVGDVTFAPKSTAAAAQAMAVDHRDALEDAETLSVAALETAAFAGTLVDSASDAAGMDTAEGSGRDQEAVPLAEMTVPQLKEQLRTRNMSVSGRKAELVHRLETALAAHDAAGVGTQAEGSGRGRQGRQPVAGVQPGTEGLGEMTTFEVWLRLKVFVAQCTAADVMLHVCSYDATCE